MNLKKEVFIVGPIFFGGGRYLEVNQIAEALKRNYSVKILSTESFIYPDLVNGNSFTNSILILDELIYRRCPELKLLSQLAYIKNKKFRKPYSFVNNKWSKKFFSYNKKRQKVLFDNLLTADVVILTMQLSSGFLGDIINFCNTNNIKCVVRPTGTIKTIPFKLLPLLTKADLFLYHSKKNSIKLQNHINTLYKIIDQSVSEEKTLLNLPLGINYPIRFGFLGRLSQEKGISPLSKFFCESGYSFTIGGDGPLKEKILDIIKGYENCRYAGHVTDKAHFFKGIDVLIISSSEETGPYTGLEAMAAGKLIISTNVGAMEERLKDTGNEFWFDINNNQSLAFSINKMEKMSADNLKSISVNLRSKYLREYSQSKISSKYLQAITELTSSN